MSSLLNCLIIFGRCPVPGKTKTRLIPFLGPAGAAQLQKELTESVVKKARSVSHIADIFFFFEGGSRAIMKKWLGKDLFYLPQKGADLGERMRNAIFKMKNMGYERIVLIGTDIPGISSDHIKEAFFRLKRYDLVIGPSEDEGYWLIGMRGAFDIFSGIEWGSEKVLRQTLDLVKKKNLTFFLLDKLTDIDSVEDLKKIKIEKRPYVSVIIPALNEQENIAFAIRSARSADSEIIVVDGGSTDRTKKIAAQEGATVIESERGRAVQQNKGAEIANGKVLLFLHADTVLPENYVSHIFYSLMDPEFIVGAFRFKTEMRHPFMRIIEFVANIRARYLGLPYGDQALFMKREFFKSIGGFPELPLAEDLYLMQRISRMGKIKIIPADAITSSRKWKRHGMLKITYLHWKIFFTVFMKNLKKMIY